ncbi:flavocytochrome c [Vagococcus sp. BWB3-3]|uniref:Urocanate reductase n=1 Tax=Vagococcus allomyrinae TaxID=2794353 RepID=A0A940SVC9_9ENTE|nr:flavocytochrome c [Vagococcus allomyrinae]MBP1042210.1 flavocytochrome c [Vagococcus allomyrinae]
MRKKRKIIYFFAILSIILVLVGCGKNNSDSKAVIKDGTYLGESKGNGGTITAEVVIKDGKIADIKNTSDHETEGLGDEAVERIMTAMIDNNTINVDVVSGATTSSEGFIAAVKSALEKAGAKETDLMAGDKIPLTQVLDKTEYNFDVVVIGAGGAGLSSAVEAASTGVKVAVLEKTSAVGGNTAVSGGAFNVPGSDLQKKKGIDDSVDQFVKDALEGGDNLANPELVKIVGEHALEAYEWMRDDIKAEFIQDRVQQFGGHKVPRSVIPVGNTGSELTNKLKVAAEAKGAEVFLDTEATDLIQDKSGNIVGVTAKNNGKSITFNASKGVVIASGGFASNVDMRTKYNADYGKQYMTTAVPASTGDGIIMGEEVGADLVDMEQIQVYPTASPKTGIISYVANSRFDGGLLINQEANRFINEVGRRDVISKAILDQPGGYAYLVWGQEIESVGHMTDVHQAEFDKMKKDDVIFEAKTLEEAAKHYDIDPQKFVASIARFNGFVSTETDPDFQKLGAFVKVEQGPFYIQKVIPSTHHTMGGLRINKEAEVLDLQGKKIPGLYAAGEVTGGIHGTNRLGGNAITDIIVFGRIAGGNVSK